MKLPIYQVGYTFRIVVHRTHLKRFCCVGPTFRNFNADPSPTFRNCGVWTMGSTFRIVVRRTHVEIALLGVNLLEITTCGPPLEITMLIHLRNCIWDLQKLQNRTYIQELQCRFTLRNCMRGPPLGITMWSTFEIVCGGSSLEITMWTHLQKLQHWAHL